MPFLPYISDENLLKHTGTLVNSVSKAQKRIDMNIYGSVIDPFSSMIDASTQDIEFAKWLEQEKARKAQKALQNALGDFHQNILGSVTGWVNAGQGGSYDVKNSEVKIIAEIKNKYNTLNSEGLLSVYDKLSSHLDYGDSGFTAYYVAVLPKNSTPYNEPFTPVKKKVARPSRDDLRKVDGRTFYGIATGHENALDQLYDVLPVLLDQLEFPVKKSNLEHFKDLFDRAYK